MIKFLVVDRIKSAAEFAETHGWTPLGLNRYGTPEGDDVRVVDRMNQLTPATKVLLFIKGPNFNHNPEIEDFLTAVRNGEAKWTK
jgi:hypothetical protein